MSRRVLGFSPVQRRERSFCFWAPAHRAREGQSSRSPRHTRDSQGHAGSALSICDMPPKLKENKSEKEAFLFFNLENLAEWRDPVAQPPGDGVTRRWVARRWYSTPSREGARRRDTGQCQSKISQPPFPPSEYSCAPSSDTTDASKCRPSGAAQRRHRGSLSIIANTASVVGLLSLVTQVLCFHRYIAERSHSRLFPQNWGRSPSSLKQEVARLQGRRDNASSPAVSFSASDPWLAVPDAVPPGPWQLRCHPHT